MIKTYKNTIEHIFTENKNNKIIFIDDICHNKLKHLILPSELISYGILGFFSIQDLPQQFVCENYDIYVIMMNYEPLILEQIFFQYTNEKYVYFFDMIHKDFFSPLVEFGKDHKNNIKKICQIPLNYTIVSDYCVFGDKIFEAIQNEPTEIITTDEKIRTKIRKLSSQGIYKESNSKLIVLDRNYDKLIYRLIPWHYESMVHFHDIKILNDGVDDIIYSEIRNKKFDEVIEYVDKKIVELENKKVDKNDAIQISDKLLKKKIYIKHYETLYGLSDFIKFNNIFIRSENEQRLITICKKNAMQKINDIGDKMKNVMNKTFQIAQTQTTENTITQDINPEILSIATNMTEKNYQNNQNPIYMQYEPKIRDIMEKYNETAEIIYIYIKDFICYEEIYEIENFNKFSDTKFYLLSDNCKNYWNYSYSSKINSNDKINEFNIHIDLNKNIYFDIYAELKEDLNILKKSFVDSRDYEHKTVQNLINSINNKITIEFKKIDEINVSNDILKNKKSYLMTQLRNITLELQKYTKKCEKYNIEIKKKIDEELLDSTQSQNQNQKLEQINLDEQTNYINQREKDINELYENITSMNKIFVDLNVIINAQDKIISNINENILKSSDFIKKANIELTETHSQVKKTNKFNAKLALGGTLLTLGTILKITK